MSDVAAATTPAPSTSTPAPASSPSNTKTQSNAASASSSGAPANGTTNVSGDTTKNVGATDTTRPNSKLADPSPDQKINERVETKAAAEERLKFQMRVDGQDSELELTRAEIQTRLQKALAAEKRMAQAAETKKAFESFREAFKKDPFEAAKHLHPDLDLDALAEQRIIERFQAEQLKAQDPIKYELEQAKKERDALKAEQARIKKEADDRAQAEHDAKVGQQMEKEFMEALEISGLPKDRQYLRMMAEVADAALEHEIELSPAQMAAEVNSRIREQHQHVTKGMKGEALIKHLGDDVVREVLKYSVEKHRSKQSVVTAPTAQGDETPTQREARQIKTGSEMRQLFRNLKDGK